MQFFLEFKSLNQLIDAEDRALSPSDTTASVYKVFETALVPTNVFIYESSRERNNNSPSRPRGREHGVTHTGCGTTPLAAICA